MTQLIIALFTIVEFTFPTPPPCLILKYFSYFQTKGLIHRKMLTDIS